MSDTPEDTTNQTHNLNDLLTPELAVFFQKLYDQSSKDGSIVIESNFGVLTFKRWPES